VASLIDTLQPGEIGAPGSDVGSAVLAALALLQSEAGQKGDVVILSDGEDQGARVTEAVQRAKSRGIEVSTIVIGSAQGSTIPTGDGPLRDGSGDVVTTYARTDVLRRIATDTGGLLLENPFGARDLDALLGRADTTERRTHARVPIDRFQWPLSLALLSMLGASVLNRGAD
jgi:Ca-activated chloride channel homolog